MKKSSIGYKFVTIFVTVSMLALITSGLLSFFQLWQIRNITRDSLIDLSHQDIQNLANEKGAAINSQFQTYVNLLKMMTGYTEDIYANPQDYLPKEVPFYLDMEEGALGLHYFPNQGKDASLLADETMLLGNAEKIFAAVMAQYPEITTICIATETGQNVQFDTSALIKQDVIEGGLSSHARPWYIDAKIKSDYVISDTYRDIAGRGLIITISQPIIANNVFKGVLRFDIRINDLDERLRKESFGKSGRIELVGKGKMISKQNLTSDNEHVLPEYWGELSRSKSETGTALIGSEYIIWSNIPLTDWKIVLLIPEDEITVPVKKADSRIYTAILLTVLLLVGIVLLTVYAAYISARRITVPIQKLTTDAELIGAGDLDRVLEINTGDELETLANAFNSMIASIKSIAAEKEQVELTSAEKEQEAKIIHEAYISLQAILDMLPVGVRILNMEDASILYDNKALIAVFGGPSDNKAEGFKAYDLMPEKQPDGRLSVDVLFEHMQTNAPNAEWLCIKQNGDPIICRVNSVTINYKGIRSSLAVIEDMTAEKAYQDMLRNVALKEQEANQLKSRFLANMSHEIRTPMNAILGMSELALREDEKDAKNEHIHTVRQAASNLLSIINDILDFSKIEAGKLEIVPGEYSVASLLNDVVNIVMMRLADSRLCFAVKADSNIPNTLYGDVTRIRQSVLNILNNAVKYTEKGFVSFNVYGEFAGNETVNLIFEVTDSGIGIKPEDIDKLFNDFTQVNLESNKGIEGVGLGLAITHRIVKLMDGDIAVQSVYGKGSTFTITLPQKVLSHAALAEVHNPENKSVLVYDKNELYADSLAYAVKNLGADCALVTSGTGLYKLMESRTYDYLFISYELFKKNEDTVLKFGKGTRTVILAEFGDAVPEKNMNVLTMPVYCTHIADLFNGTSGSSSYSADSEVVVRFSAPSAKVLVVDDIITNLKVAQGLLSPYNMRVDLCKNGATAIKAVQSDQYDLVFMDHKMPGMDGIETTKRIREWEREQLSIINYQLSMNNEQSLHPTPYTPLPIIALTANAILGMPEMFIENGFNDFLSKPIDTIKLNEILKKWIPKDKQERERL